MISVANALAGRKVTRSALRRHSMVGRNLASLGAEVIKIERPVVGDDGRHSHPDFDGDGLFFTETGYGKKSVVLDLKSKRTATAQDMIDRADVVLRICAR